MIRRFLLLLSAFAATTFSACTTEIVEWVEPAGSADEPEGGPASSPDDDDDKPKKGKGRGRGNR